MPLMRAAARCPARKMQRHDRRQRNLTGPGQTLEGGEIDSSDRTTALTPQRSECGSSSNRSTHGSTLSASHSRETRRVMTSMRFGMVICFA